MLYNCIEVRLVWDKGFSTEEEPEGLVFWKNRFPGPRDNNLHCVPAQSTPVALESDVSGFVPCLGVHCYDRYTVP